MDVNGKTKDNLKARMDIKKYCRRKELWLQELQNGKIVKPKASFSFTLDEKREICECVKNLRIPEDYASNLGKRADMDEGKLIVQHPQHILEEVSDDEILNVEEEISENEENESFDDEEWDDNENETTEEDEWENDGIETTEEE
ncbi:hypothetical protein MTR67_034409 [Solanum verrucosum]|uniref:Uncharacterized protein n=1 Tax=Solanum verrucosum TaxID=315347 RepID=A0AAF0U8I1_SOLVR|nr:hypothetical protein MTR67_034409 [Solanum verrucosum]